MIADVLEHLEKVRKTGNANWIACCPAHEDRSPSLTIHDAGDGRVLVHCHAGCRFDEIVSSSGAGYDAFFPPNVNIMQMPKRAFPAADVLEAVQFETTLVAVAACNLANGVVLTVEDKERLMTAYHRISEARRLALA